MTRAIQDLFETDWEDQLADGDTAKVKDVGDVVLLAGLRRLARKAGLVRQSVVIQTPSDSMVQAIYTSVFAVGEPDELGQHSTVSFVGAADCNTKNTAPKFAIYPTAIAESRAEARSLRNALGISMLSSEEVGFREGAGALEASPTGRAGSQLVSAVAKLCETRDVAPAAVLEAVLDDERAADIMGLDELTVAEAQKAMSWLNEKKHKQTAAAKRIARKKELEGKK